MYAEERQQAMATTIATRGRVSVNSLAGEYAVTTETVRRDLTALERAGLVRRVHGGAVPASALTVLETGVSDRDQSRTAEKDRIAQAALTLLPPAGGSIVLDAGTTTSRLATLLPRDQKLTVFTHAVPIAARLAGQSNIELHLLPGRVRATTQAAVGEQTVAALRDLRVDVAFLGANGVSADHGFSTPDSSEASAKRAIVACARQAVVLTDSSKLGLDTTVRFASVAEIDVLVTDDNADAEDLAMLRAEGLEVVVA